MVSFWNAGAASVSRTSRLFELDRLDQRWSLDGDDDLPCLPHSGTVFQDQHDGDQKIAEESGDELIIRSADKDQTWSVKAKLDKKTCSAVVDFRVPGKPNPPPVNLLATIWITFRIDNGVVVSKNTIEFTDPSGKLAKPNVPLNTWVQVLRDDDEG